MAIRKELTGLGTVAGEGGVCAFRRTACVQFFRGNLSPPGNSEYMHRTGLSGPRPLQRRR